MPTIFTESGLRFFFYSDEGNEPIQVHVSYGGSLAKFWIKPNINLANNIGMKPKQIKRAKELIKENMSLIEEKWNEFDRRRKNL